MTKQTKETRLQLWQRQTTWLAHVNTAHRCQKWGNQLQRHILLSTCMTTHCPKCSNQNPKHTAHWRCSSRCKSEKGSWHRPLLPTNTVATTPFLQSCPHSRSKISSLSDHQFLAMIFSQFFYCPHNISSRVGPLPLPPKNNQRYVTPIPIPPRALYAPLWAQ